MKKIFVLNLMVSIIFALSPVKFIYSQTQDSELIEFLEFKDVDIKDVLRQLAKQYNLNIVFSESVTGLVTVRLANVSIQQALDSIITVNGFAYNKKDNVYKVTTPAEAEREGKMTKLFRINNADAAKLKETLKNVLTSEGSIEADVRSNSVIVTDIPGVINKVESMLPDLDSVTPQVLIEARFIETTLGATEKLGIDWTATASATGSLRPTTVPFKRWDSGGDMYPVPEYSAEVDEDTGLTTVTTDFPIKGDLVGWPNDVFTLGSFPMAGADQFLFGTLDFSQFRSILNLIMSKTDSKLLSSPRLVTMENNEAVMYVGKTRPIPTFKYNEDTGTYEITGFAEKIEGVTLTVTPAISKTKDGKYNIKLKLKPKVSTFSENVPFVTLGFNYPVLSERYADTEVIIEDGQTIVIGGLMETKRTQTVKKIPILGDIPLLGLLFTHKDVDPQSKSDLLIFVTAKVVEQKEAGILAYQSHMVTSPPRPFKLEAREIK